MSVKPEWLFEVAPLYFRPESIKNIETRKAMQKVEKAILDGKKKKWAVFQFQLLNNFHCCLYSFFIQIPLIYLSNIWKD